MSRAVRGLPLLAVLLCGGCLFHDAPPPRYYTPPSSLVAADDPPAQANGRPVRLRRVRTAGYIGEQICWRGSDVEHGLYEQRRWTDHPTRYLERAMDVALDRTPGLRRVESGRVPTLDLDLVSFDEVVAPTREADVEVVAVLRDPGQTLLFQRTFSARRPIPDADPDSTARAMGSALDDVVVQIASQVAASL
jgi:ABC-type uncharacterized transport system auxiliary subunit